MIYKLAGRRAATRMIQDDYVDLIKKASESGSLEEAKLVHARIVWQGLEKTSVFLCNLVVEMYGRCSGVDEAWMVFQSMGQRNQFSWNSMVAAYARTGHLLKARSLLDKMPNEGIIAVTVLMTSYAKTGEVDHARQMFDRVPQPDVVSWTAMIRACAQNGESEESFRMFSLMDLEGCQPDDFTLVTVLDACPLKTALLDSVAEQPLRSSKVSNALLIGYSKSGDVSQAKRIFNTMHSSRKNTMSWNAMLAAYSSSGHTDEAGDLFKQMVFKDVVSWTTMVAAYVHQGRQQESVQVFRQMILEGVKPNVVSFLAVLGAVSSSDGIFHKMLVESGYSSDPKVQNALLNVFSRSGDAAAAKRLFDGMSSKNVVAWTSMIKSQRGQDALHIFRLMELDGIKPNEVTFIELVDAVALLQDLREIDDRAKGCSYHSQCGLGNSLISAYGRLGSLEDAKSTFDQIVDKTVVSWSSMMAAYSQCGQAKEALELFRLMDMEGVQMLDQEITWTSVVDACASNKELELGSLVHEEISQLSSNRLDKALVNMYGKCGSVAKAVNAFDRMKTRRDVVVWTALIAACADNGAYVRALEAFQEMKLEGVLPNEVTMVNVLAACSHAGLLDVGVDQFVCMVFDYGLVATDKHFVCLIDLLARAGRLDDADELAATMTGQVDVVTLRTLLGAGRLHGQRSNVATECPDYGQHSASYELLLQMVCST